MRACKHGQLARSCNICELEADRDRWYKQAHESEQRYLNMAAKAEALAEALKHIAGIHAHHRMGESCVPPCPHAIGREALSAYEKP